MPAIIVGQPQKSDRFQVTFIEATVDKRMISIDFYDDRKRRIPIAKNALFTYLAFRASSNRQIIPSLGGQMYIYAFGPLPGRLTIGGVFLTTPECGQTNQSQEETNLISILSNTYQNFIVHKYIKPLFIVIENKEFMSFFDHLSFEFKDPSTRLGGFIFSFATLMT